MRSGDKPNYPLMFWLSVAVVTVLIIFYNHAHSASINNPNPQPGPTQPQQPQEAFNSYVISSKLDKFRSSSGLPAMTDNYMLDLAASARANDMVSKGYFDNSSNDPGGFITKEGYTYSKYSLGSVAASSSQDAIDSLTTGNLSSFLKTSDFSDYGIGISDNQPKYVVVYLANKQTASYDGGYQYYWYCWDNGQYGPHHLGYHVYGDHLCSITELHNFGWPGY